MAQGTLTQLSTSTDRQLSDVRVSVSRDSLTVNIQGSDVTVQRSPPSRTIPHDAESKLNDWCNKEGINTSESKLGRVPYETQDIGRALEIFQNEYHCSWAEMKEGCQDKVVLQVVNDLRSSYLKEIFQELNHEFPGIKIHDFGSTKLTSDRDFSFAVSPTNQTTESKIVTRFNAIFESKWHSPSATVFDSNAYTMQYVLSASDPEIEAKRSKLQQEGSLLMKLRTSTPDSWSNFKNNTLAGIKDQTKFRQKEFEFARVEQKNKNLELILNKEIVRQEVRNAANSNNIILDEQAIVLEGNQATESEKYATAAQEIKLRNPHAEIEASNALHEEFKSNYALQEQQRLEVFSTLKKLDGIDSPAEFAQVFNEFHENLIHSLEDRLSREQDPSIIQALSNRIEILQSSKIDEGQEAEVMSAYHERRGLEETKNHLLKEIKSLESEIAELNQLKNEATGDLFKLGLLAYDDKKIKINVADLKFMDAVTIRAKTQLKGKLEQHNTKSIAEVEEKLKQKKAKSTEQLNLVNTAILEKKGPSGYGENWKIAGSIDLEGDRLLVQMQESNLQGMCFAQEAHVSEGAFGVVVLNIQARSSEVRTPGQYVQAYREISGFYSGHQLHENTPVGRMIEASKYADRLAVVYDNIKKRSEALGVRPPDVQIKVNELRMFFKAVSPLRGEGLSDTEKQAKVNQAAQIIFSRNCDDKFVEHINSQFDD